MKWISGIFVFTALIGSYAHAANPFLQYNGSYTVVSCEYGDCADSFGKQNLMAIRIEGDADQFQIYSMTLGGNWSPYSDFPIHEGKWTDTSGTLVESTWLQSADLIGNRMVWYMENMDQSSVVTLEPTASGLKLTFSAGIPDQEVPKQIAILAPN